MAGIDRLAPRGAWALSKCAATHWASDQAATIGAALAFYCAFSLAPLLIILVTVTGWIVGAETAYGQLSYQLTSLFGAATANILLEAMQSSQSSLYYSAQIFLLGAEFTACLGSSRKESAGQRARASHSTS